MRNARPKPPGSAQNCPDVSIGIRRVTWRSWVEKELYRIRTCSVHFFAPVHVKTDLLLPNIHRSCHSQPVPDRPAVLMIAWEKLDGSPQVMSRQQPINVAFYVSDGGTFARTNTRFHNIQLSLQSHLRAQLMTRGSSHQIDPLGQMSVEARCVPISSAQIPRTFLQPDFRKADKRSFLEEPEMAAENKAAGIPLQGLLKGILLKR